MNPFSLVTPLGAVVFVNNAKSEYNQTLKIEIIPRSLNSTLTQQTSVGPTFVYLLDRPASII